MTDADARARLDALAERDPGLAPMLALYRAALAEASDAAWDAVVRTAAPPAPGAPRLAGAVLDVSPARTSDWVGRLARGAGDLADGALAACAARVDPSALVLASVRLDDATLADLARRVGVLPETLTALAHLAALPLLAAVGRRLAADVPADWDDGRCPVCCAWPTLAETRGIDMTRRLRCGRCGADWAWPRLRCPFCDLDDHERLGAIVPDDERDLRRIDTCARCLGYLKAVPTLTPLTLAGVVVEDLATVALDVAAMDRGFRRPGAPPGAPLDVTPAGASRT